MDSNNYDVYIQRGVRIVDYNNRDRGNIVEYINSFSSEIDKNNYCCRDFRGIDSFFLGFEVFAGYRIIECNKENGINRYISIDELNRGYIKLYDFIMDGKFIGREFVRIEPVVTYYNKDIDNARIVDNRYLRDRYYNSNNKYIVLYEKDNTFLVKIIYFDSEYYGIIDCRYIQDRKYEFVGDVYDRYKNREKVYVDILEQVVEYDRRYKCRIKNK